MAEKITIITNNLPRDVIYAHDLTNRERGRLMGYDWEAIERGDTNPSFVRYGEEVIDANDFQSIGQFPVGHPFHEWDSFASDSFFSGLLIRWVPGTNFEQVIIGRYSI